MTKVVNINTCDEQYDFYIGRRLHCIYHWGNPFKIGIDGNREECVRKFRYWIESVAYTNIESKRRKWILDNMWVLKDKVLACYCAPLSCHGDVYVELLDK